MKLLCGDYRTQSGTASALEESQLVTSQPTMIMGTLMENLLYGIVPDAAFDEHGLLKDPLPELVCLPASEECMWRLCKAAGVSRVLIGDTFEKGKWASQQLTKVMPWLPRADSVQIGLVRALLHRPSVLLLLRVGSDWSLDEQASLHCIIEAYLTCNGDIEQMVDEIEAGNPKKLTGATSLNSVVICAADPLLGARLNMERDMVLTIETPSRATFKKVADGLNDKAITDDLPPTQGAP